jgi:mono/diheme cytochrome c family protein
MKKRVTFIAMILTAISFFSFQQKQKFDLKASITRGQDVYVAQCMSCHLEEGEGIEDLYPPLGRSDYLMDDKQRSIDNVIHGLSGEIKVNGKIYNSEMFAFELTDEETSDVLNYIRNSWGNKGEAITPDEVNTARK